MNKSIEFNSLREVRTLKLDIYKNMISNASMLKDLFNNDNLEILYSLKFKKCSFDTKFLEPMNFIEMLNQSFTYLVSLCGLEYLFQKYPNEIFTANFGTQSGFDIFSHSGNIVSECFTATSPKSNQKLKKDVERLNAFTTATSKYVFFHSPNNEHEYINKMSIKYPDVNIIFIENIIH